MVTTRKRIVIMPITMVMLKLMMMMIKLFLTAINDVQGNMINFPCGIIVGDDTVTFLLFIIMIAFLTLLNS